VVWRVIFYYLNIVVGIVATIPILHREMALAGEDHPKG